MDVSISNARSTWFRRRHLDGARPSHGRPRRPARTRALFGPLAGLAGLCLLLVVQAPAAAAHTTAAPASIRDYALPTPGAQPGGIVAGPDGALWFYETGTNSIGRITTDGQISEYPIPTADASQLYQGFLGVGPDGALWFSENRTVSLGRLTMDGQFTETPLDMTVRGHLPDRASIAVLGLVAGPDGALWFTSPLSNSIWRLAMDGQLDEYVVPTPDASPAGIVVAPDGSLWFTEPPANQLGRITLDGAISEYPIPTPGSFTVRLTIGPDGAVWFAEIRGDKIGRMGADGEVTEYPVAGMQPVGISSGPDGALWFCGFNSHEIGRITLDGQVERFPVPTPKSVPYHIVAGPDGALWFTEQDTNKIGRLEIPPAQAVASTR